MFTSAAKAKPTTKKSKQEDVIDYEILEAVFNEFADPDDSEIITMEGISKISEHLGIDPSADVRILVILWRLGSSSKPGVITKAEFIAGMRALRKDSIAGLKELLPSFDPGFLNRNQFRGTMRLVFIYLFYFLSKQLLFTPSKQNFIDLSFNSLAKERIKL